MEPLLGSYNNRVHNFLIDFDGIVNMYIPCFLQVVFPYLKIIKNEKRVKVLKEISKEKRERRDKNKT